MIFKINFMNLVAILLFLIIFGLSLYLKFMPILNNNFPFTMDQARDMLDIREIVVSVHPTLIGPTTSINGVFLGPGYYYFNVLPFLISGGDPAALTYWNILWYTLGALVLFYFNFKRDKIFAFIASILFLMSPAFFYSSRYFWSANPMPYITTFYFLCLIRYVLKRDIKSAFLAGLMSGLSMQFEAAFGVIFFPFLLIYSFIRKIPIKTILFSGIGFFVTLLPQAFFELRHNFIMTQTFFKEVSGKSQILGENLSFVASQLIHLLSFMEFTTGILAVPTLVSYGIIIAAVIYLSVNFKKLSEVSTEYFLASVLFVLFAIIFYSWYLHPLKGWYLLGLRIPYIIIIALFLSEVFRLKHFVFKFFVAGLIGFSFINTFTTQEKFVPDDASSRSSDKSTLRNELEVIDWVYDKAKGQGFRAYNYIPSVYDFPYNYLYWWHGGRRYNYHPDTVTYLDNVPEYIKNNDEFLTKKKPADGSMIFLIYEPDENPQRLYAWLGNFTKYCTVEKQVFDWGTTVESRRYCP